MIIRRETIPDYPDVYDVNKLAFGQEGEAKLVEAIRQTDNYIPDLSLIVLEHDRVVGHILFSKVVIRAGTQEVPALALAPMAVRPEFQRKGIGSILVEEGLKKCAEIGHTVVVVLGHVDFYPRFGFVPASKHGVTAPFPVPDEAFMVVELKPGALNGINGTVIYPPEFDNV